MRRAGSFSRAVWLIALLCAMSVRFLCPPGWMPNPQAASGGAWLVICTGHGPLSTNDGAPAKSHSGAADHCAFAGLAHALPPPAPASPPPQVAAEPAASVRVHEDASPRLDRWRAQAARGPPALA